ncbi:NUDIX domain-containing protein [Candidatus Micrarchaeota archaeon]|nr:NUDIX domain-containing protein [Candidatus Micrarchaeota archaeon]
MEKKRPFIGIGVIVIRDGRVLLGKRRNAHGEGTWCFPGGHLEFNEEPEAAAERETREETGIQIMNVRRGPFTNDFFEHEGKHYITLYLIAEWASGEPMVMEPQKCEAWDWFEWDSLPSPLFLCVENLLKQGFNPLK